MRSSDKSPSEQINLSDLFCYKKNHAPPHTNSVRFVFQKGVTSLKKNKLFISLGDLINLFVYKEVTPF